jgi:energy-coupling factor transporter ATP-binding protein EcfA2
VFGFVFQCGQLVPELPAVENVSLPRLRAGRRRTHAVAAAAPGLSRLGLDGLGDRLPGQLSGGQSQRVAVARALVASPTVVFADEPTGSLDSVAADEVTELLVDASREQGTSVLVVTHQARVAAYADRTVMVRDSVDALRAGSWGRNVLSCLQLPARHRVVLRYEGLVRRPAETVRRAMATDNTPPWRCWATESADGSRTRGDPIAADRRRTRGGTAGPSCDRR